MAASVGENRGVGKVTLLFGVLFGFGLNAAMADISSRIEQDLLKFHQNPASFMNDPKYVEKVDARTGQVIKPRTSLSIQQRQKEDFVAYREQVRLNLQQSRAVRGEPITGRSAIAPHDRPEDLVDSFEVSTLKEIEDRGLMSSRLDQSPWSGDYWEIVSGQIAKRYADERFPESPDWKINRDYLLRTHMSSSVDQLSPAEKYDLLVGDADLSLTKSNVNEGQAYYNAIGSVESWMGICHGWAPASYMEDRPTHAVSAMAADNHTRITFYPSDIKALASLLWANASPQVRFVGGRCDQKNAKFGEDGRIIDQECYDTNPATWHLSVVNQIGISKRSFIMDASYDYEVWNQPILGYKYTYFNPKTSKAVERLDEALVPLNDFEKDVFHKYRTNPDAVSVVGISAEITYVGENFPTIDLLDSSKDDIWGSVNYLYDLELDRNGKIVGGEWYHNMHPDFLWTPPPGSQAKTAADRLLDRLDAPSEWDNLKDVSMPELWKKLAVKNSRAHLPLMHIVKALIKNSNLNF
ncbi:MAG: hypothetical protein ABIQ95_09085 [Bdellovibrionia bacterium]